MTLPPPSWSLVLPALLALALTVAGSRWILGLHRRHPGGHPAHKPAQRGGLTVVPALLAGWMLAASTPGPLAPWAWVSVAGAPLLMVASWADDRHSLPAGPRLAAHAGVVVGALIALPGNALVFQGWLPLWADRALTGLGWVWFLNLFAAMDGVDGLGGVQTGSIGLGVALVAGLAGVATGVVPFALAVAAAGLGFVVWNWHPARISLGDAGSVPLGFLQGGLLVHLAAAGEWAAALILPACYLADAAATLARRAATGEAPWRAHRRHFCQRAVHGGRSHARVALAVLVANLLLIAAALVSTRAGAAGLAAAALVAAGLLALLQRWSKDRPA